MKKIIMVLLGTRPEAIKLAPIIKKLKTDKTIKTLVCSTGQHREMLNHVLDIFKIKIDYDLDLMKANQDLFDISINTTLKLKEIFITHKPNFIIVQGDTSTAFIAALSAFYLKIKIAHVEAGLRSFNIYSPFPEEANRKFISIISTLNFVPTKDASDNLIAEGFSKNNIWITGNTVIDALIYVKKLFANKKYTYEIEKSFFDIIHDNIFDKKFILITMHRREKFGKEFNKILKTLKSIAEENPDYYFIYPVHLNPNVTLPVHEILKNIKNIILLKPLDYLKFSYLMSKCYFILSDSGGVQEECYMFKKPILVLREVTERTEAIKAGYAFLVGKNSNEIKSKFYFLDKKLKDNFNFFNIPNPYGDGKSSNRIIKILKSNL